MSVVQTLVPEDSVIPETQTLVILNWRKGFVGSLRVLFIKRTGKIESNRGNWTILREGLKYVDFK